MTRSLIVSLFALSLVACSGQSPQPASGSTPLTVVSYGGGAYQVSHQEAFIQPFSTISGTRTESATWNADFGKLKAMIQSGNVSWDVVDVTAAIFQRGLKENFFERLSVPIDSTHFMANSVSEYGVANVYWGTVLAYRSDSFGQTGPRSWADFWDVDRYPGPRALYDDPRGTLEFALLADGVPKDQLYPLDVDRAFQKLDIIRPSIKVWWTDGSQPLQLLLNGTVLISPCWNGRLFASPESKTKIHYVWDGAALELDYWIIPRGSMNVDAASRFIFFASAPEALARQAALIGYGPANSRALQLLDPALLPDIPTSPDNWQRSFVVNAEWWAENEAIVKNRWLQWKGR